jgi:hypothetical protein
VIHGLLFQVSADPQHSGARIGLTLVLHSWGSALTHIRRCTASSPAAACRPTGDTELPAGSVSSCRKASSHECFGGVSFRRPMTVTHRDMGIVRISPSFAPQAFFGNLCAEKAQG